MSLYYANDDTLLYQGDCLDVMATLPAGLVDTGRMAIGIELQEEYCATAARRLTK